MRVPPVKRSAASSIGPVLTVRSVRGGNNRVNTLKRADGRPVDEPFISPALLEIIGALGEVRYGA